MEVKIAEYVCPKGHVNYADQIKGERFTESEECIECGSKELEFVGYVE
jgi:Zn ribbon nucleic-acid-binding protein